MYQNQQYQQQQQQQQAQTNGNSIMVQGRILWTSGSSLFEGKHKKNQNTNQLEFDDKGNPVMEYGFGLAIPKLDPRTQQFTPEYVKAYQAIHGEALTLYPSGQLPPGFALKYKDGDTVDHNGVPFAQREGHANHIILACTTRIPIKFFRFEGNNNMLVSDGIKCGDYVNVALNIKAHPAKGQGKPGVYLNPSAVQLIQSGKEIVNTPSGDQMFGTAAPVYSGEVVAPVIPQMPMGAPMMPGQQLQQTPQAPMMPNQQQYQQPAPQAPAPYHNVLPPNMQPGQQQYQQPAPPMGAPMMPGQQQYAAPQAPMGAPMMPPMPGMPR
jgi:hypothetical protein